MTIVPEPAYPGGFISSRHKQWDSLHDDELRLLHNWAVTHALNLDLLFRIDHIEGPLYEIHEYIEDPATGRPKLDKHKRNPRAITKGLRAITTLPVIWPPPPRP